MLQMVSGEGVPCGGGGVCAKGGGGEGGGGGGWSGVYNSGFPAKWRLRSELRNSIPMTCHYPDLGSASDFDRAATEICFYSTTQI